MMAATMSLAAADSGLWKVRALQLAEEKRLIGTARLLWVTVYGREVTVDTTSGRIHCDCPSTRACSHQGAVISAMRMREQALRAIQSEQDWRRECDMGGALLDCARGWD